MKQQALIIIFFVLIKTAGVGQVLTDSNYIDINSFNDSIKIAGKTMLFIDSNHSVTAGNILQQQFVPFLQFSKAKKIPQHLVTSPTYLKFYLYNSGDTAKNLLFFPGSLFDTIKIYKLNAASHEFYENATDDGFANLLLQPGEKNTYLARLHFTHVDYNILSPQLIYPKYMDTYKRIYRSRVEATKIFGYITSGMLFIIILFVAANFFLYRKKEFLYYLGYAFFNFVLMLSLAVLNHITGNLSSFFYGYFDLVLLIISGIFYLAFIRHFLETKTTYPVLEKSFKLTEAFLLGSLILYSILHYFTNWYAAELLLENLMKVILLGLGIMFIIIAFKQKKKLLTYLAVGNAFSIIFSIISLLLIWYKINGPVIFQNAIFYYNTGVIFSLGFFLLGLAYKNRTELIENLKQQAALKIDFERQEMENQIKLIKAQQEERNRISADMHDDLGAGMTTIRLYSELAKNRLGSTEVPEIEKISSSANELLTKMNAIIWSMSSSNDSLGNMVAYIRSYSLEYFEGTGIKCVINLPEEDLPNIVVAGAIRRNVFLVVKESLNNIVKHSGAAEVHITLEKVSGGLKLLIHDNGKGIDFEKLRQFGNGLKNMKKRMDDIGINFSIENNEGTLITLYRAIPDF
jgi:signal transduction histidine kinase